MEDAELPRFEMTGEEVLHRGWAITVTLAHFTDPDGVAFDRDVIRHPGAVAVVAITPPAPAMSRASPPRSPPTGSWPKRSGTRPAS
jgi:hypothetical protein